MRLRNLNGHLLRTPIVPSHGRQQRASVKERIQKMSVKPEDVYVIHYSCESFYGIPEGRSPRVTSIAVRNFSSGQTASFSIHKFAELNGVALGRVKDAYDDLEQKMLHEFYEWVRDRQSSDWVHWNMRDINYGFPALEHRFTVLGGTPVRIDESRKFDLSRALVTLYGRGYSEHPRLESLMKMNRMTDKDFLSGEDEAKAFESGQYIELHLSTLRKVDTLCSFLESMIKDRLRTRARWHERHDVRDLIGMVKEHWLVVTVTISVPVLGVVTGALGCLRTAWEFLVSQF